MKKIIVFTNEVKWYDVPPFDKSIKDLQDLTINLQHFIKLFWKENGYHAQAITNQKEGEIILAYDEIEEKKFNEFMSGYAGGGLYILYHINKKVDSDKTFNTDLLPKNATIKKGTHTITPGHGYYEFKKIVCGDENKSIDEIIEAVFGIDNKLNTVLEFLHKCLLNTVIDDDKKKLREDLSLSEEENAKLNNPKDNLSEIRDMLLGKIFN